MSEPLVSPARMTLAVVDDDDDVRTALYRLLRSYGHDVRVFSSAEAFQANKHPVDCVILDIRLPGLNGLELRERLHAAGRRPPMVFITGDGDRFFASDLPAHVRALRKPFDEYALIDAVREAVARPGVR